MQSVYKPIGTVCLCGAFLYGFRTNLQGTVRRDCSLILLVQNQHSGHCASSFTVSKSFSRGLSAGVGGNRLFIRLRTYFQRSKSVVLSVYMVSESTSKGLSAGNAA